MPPGESSRVVSSAGVSAVEGAAISCPWDDARLTWCLVGAVRVPRRYRFVIFAVDNCNCRRYRADNCNRSFNGDGPTQTHSRHPQSHVNSSRARQARPGPSDPRSLPLPDPDPARRPTPPVRATASTTDHQPVLHAPASQPRTARAAREPAEWGRVGWRNRVARCHFASHSKYPGARPGPC